MSTGQWTESSPASVSLPEASSWDRFTTAIRMNPASTLLATSCLALFVTSYWSTLSSLVHRWNTDPNYSHGYFVPLVSLYLFYQSIERRSPSFPAVRGGSWIGSTLLIVAIAMLWLTTLLPSLIIESASMLLALLGGVYLVWGRSIGHLAIAPVGFLVFMVPWPSKLYSQAAFPLQLAISKFASILLTMMGIPVLCDGSLIHLPGQTMHVAEACSGMRQLTAFLAMAAATALIIERPLWCRMIVLAFAVPVAVLVNITRVTSMALAHHVGYGEWTEGAMHTIEGMGMVLVGLGLLMGLVKLLDWIQVNPTGTPLAEGAHA
jgi:exosortase